MRYKVLALDSWGNPEDGWTVNDRYTLGHVHLKEPSRDQVLIKCHPFLNKNTDIVVDTFDGSILLVDDRTSGEPLLELEAEI